MFYEEKWVDGWFYLRSTPDGEWVRKTVVEMLVKALSDERDLRKLGQQPNVHWESLRDERRATYDATDAVLLAAGTQAATALPTSEIEGLRAELDAAKRALAEKDAELG